MLQPHQLPVREALTLRTHLGAQMLGWRQERRREPVHRPLELEFRTAGAADYPVCQLVRQGEPPTLYVGSDRDNDGFSARAVPTAGDTAGEAIAACRQIGRHDPDPAILKQSGHARNRIESEIPAPS